MVTFLSMSGVSRQAPKTLPHTSIGKGTSFRGLHVSELDTSFAATVLRSTFSLPTT